ATGPGGPLVTDLSPPHGVPMNDVLHTPGIARKSSACVPRGPVDLHTLLESCLLLAEDFEKLSADERAGLAALDETDKLLTALVDLGLLTEYQADRICAGTTFGLVLGNYRVLD